MQLLQQYYHGIGVYTDTVNYSETIANFREDYGPPPAMPQGIDQRVYEPDVRHAYNKGHDTVAGGPLSWPEGDAIIAAVEQLAAKKKVREDAVLEQQHKEFRAKEEAQLKKAQGETAENLKTANANLEAEMRAKRPPEPPLAPPIVPKE
jgi:hypothetical protein